VDLTQEKYWYQDEASSGAQLRAGARSTQARSSAPRPFVFIRV
jgi:hypothetical protein